MDQITPRCLDWIFHTCWSQPPATDSVPTSEQEHQARKSFEVGDFYFQNKNYRAAASRFREVLDYQPNYPEATLKLAVSLEKLGNNEEALKYYQSYLELQPAGPFADHARKAVQRLASPTPASGKRKP